MPYAFYRLQGKARIEIQRQNIRKFSNSEVLKHIPMLYHIPGHTIPKQCSFNPLDTFLPLITHCPVKPSPSSQKAMPWAVFVWLAQMKIVESGVCQLLYSAGKSPLLLFLCVAKVCILDKSPISDRGTRCCSPRRERTGCAPAPRILTPSQGASWPLALGITCCHQQAETPNTASLDCE